VFHTYVGPFGPYNEHYVRDVAAFELPLGLLLLAALRWPSWRLPALAFATAHWALHALSHLLDIARATPGLLVGVLDFVAISLGTAVLGWALVRTARTSKESREEDR
jgi:hypothetical protein